MKQAQNTARMILGVVLGLVGIIGLVVPLLPGIPFLLLSAACFNGLEMDETTPASERDVTSNVAEECI